MISAAITNRTGHVVGYARYSTDKQTENSIQYQLVAIERYCEQNDIKLSRCYVDPERSGSNTERPGFQELLYDARRGIISKVVIYDISRGSRDIVDWFTFRKEMLALGVEVVSTTQRLGDLTDPGDYLQELVQAGMAQVGLLDARKKSMDGVDVKAKEGKFLGGMPPLGYDIVNGEYVVNEVEAAIVRKIYEGYANGLSYNQIIASLKGAKGKRGRPLGKNSISSILRNPRYSGTYVWNARQVKFFGRWAGGKPSSRRVEKPGVIPRIVDEVTLQKVRARMDNNKHNARNGAKRNYLLSGLIECECGAKYVGKTNVNSKGYATSYYHCGDKYRTRKCKAKNINADFIEKFVVESLTQYLKNVDHAEAAELIVNQINNASPNLDVEKRELAAIETKIHNGVQAILSGLKIPELEEEIDSLRIRKSELEHIILRATANKVHADPQSIIRLFSRSIKDLEEQDFKSAIDNHVLKIKAHADGSFEVYAGVVYKDGCGGAQESVYTTFRYLVA